MKIKTDEQKYRFRRSDDEFPDRLLFETRYYANKYLKDKMPGLDPMYYMIQTCPFTRKEYVIMLLTYV